jgi:hypothetical protein
VVIKIQSSGGVDMSKTKTGTLVAILHAILNAAVTLSNNIASSSGVTVSVTGSFHSTIAATGKILVELPNFSWPSNPSCTFSVPSGLICNLYQCNHSIGCSACSIEYCYEDSDISWCRY